MKLWLLLARKASQGTDDDFDTAGRLDSGSDEEGANTRMVWNQLWPAFLVALQALEQDGRMTSCLVRLYLHKADGF